MFQYNRYNVSQRHTINHSFTTRKTKKNPHSSRFYPSYLLIKCFKKKVQKSSDLLILLKTGFYKMAHLLEFITEAFHVRDLVRLTTVPRQEGVRLSQLDNINITKLDSSVKGLQV